MCEQEYHGVVACALGWACWKTYVGRPETVMALYKDPCATFDDLHEAVATLEDSQRIARRVLGGAHPLTVAIEDEMRHARVVLGSRELMARLAT